jgi:aspartyl-tRNA(Asn)/glutamyl-tRNA(Gln) amidotransferase subunit A
VADEILFLSAGELAHLMRVGKLSPVEVVDAHLRRIDQIDNRLRAYLTVAADQARAAARSAESEFRSGMPRSPLLGIPYGVKDIYFTKGIRTCANSRVLLDHVPDIDATPVARLAAAGAILIGKHSTAEYGTGPGYTESDAAFPHARNPWKPNHFPGGSSTGSGVAVAAGMATFALGADTGGSVRLPAAGCGLMGLRPTYGRVGRGGVLPNSWSLDSLGPICRTVEDVALVLQAISGFDASDPGSADRAVPDFQSDMEAGVRGLTVGIVHDFGEPADIDPAVAAGIADVEAVLEREGARLVEVELPMPPTTWRQLTALISSSERSTAHEADLLERSHLMGRALRESLMAGFCARSVDYIAAQRRRRALAIEMEALLKTVDVLLLPCAFHTAPSYEDADKVEAFMRQTATTAFGVTGHPSMSIPTGFSEDGLPTSAQLVARWFDEAMVLRVARAYERTRDWRHRRPPI